MCDHKFTARRGKRIILVQMTALKPDASQGGLICAALHKKGAPGTGAPLGVFRTVFRLCE